MAVTTPVQASKIEAPSVLKPQARILKALLKGPLNKAGIEKNADIPSTWVAEYVGTENMVSELVRGAKKLIPAGFVKVKELSLDGGKTEKSYSLTASGKKMAEKLLKDDKPKNDDKKAEKKKKAKVD